MSSLDEVYDLESQKENLEIVDDYSQNDQLVIKLNYQYGSLKITIPDEFPEKTPIFEPCFNSHVPQQKTYLSFGTDLAHVIDVTESLIIGNENVDQKV